MINFIKVDSFLMAAMALALGLYIGGICTKWALDKPIGVDEILIAVFLGLVLGGMIVRVLKY